MMRRNRRAAPRSPVAASFPPSAPDAHPDGNKRDQRGRGVAGVAIVDGRLVVVQVADLCEFGRWHRLLNLERDREAGLYAEALAA